MSVPIFANGDADAVNRIGSCIVSRVCINNKNFRRRVCIYIYMWMIRRRSFWRGSGVIFTAAAMGWYVSSVMARWKQFAAEAVIWEGGGGGPEWLNAPCSSVRDESIGRRARARVCVKPLGFQRFLLCFEFSRGIVLLW